MKLSNLIAVSFSALGATVFENAHAAPSNLRRRTDTTDVDANDELVEMLLMEKKVRIRITNAAYQQPFGGFFVMIHNEEETPIFTVGENATEAMAILAEDGDPSWLVEAYRNSTNAGFVGAITQGAPYSGGESLEFIISYNDDYPYLTIASMAINTNDCFVALNGVKITGEETVLQAPGYDAGSEENNELCSSIPGPACAETPGNVRSGNGEGFVHIHRGFFGVGDLSQSGYDWRNPMMRVEMSPLIDA